jgi:hypothetical protein
VKLPQIVRSNYYKGLLVLSRRDRVIDPRERSVLIRIGKILDFDRRFCEAAIDDLLSNAHVSRSPVVFSDYLVKECFFRDALLVAHSDGHIHPMELSWLRRTARANGLSDPWLDFIIRDFGDNKETRTQCDSFEIEKHI